MRPQIAPVELAVEIALVIAGLLNPTSSINRASSSGPCHKEKLNCSTIASVGLVVEDRLAGSGGAIPHRQSG